MQIVNIRVYDLTVLVGEDFLKIPDNLDISKAEKDWLRANMLADLNNFADYLISLGAKKVKVEVYSVDKR
ncbi:MAG: hypothetical protein UW81_C0017G0009 [Candidatus Giovannonibacteria bacterium GW2011_GWC2_44_9]|uniref:Uncharacterized protein n=3 Tax=Candidatus Giovannoniibacteriota TaxID=1752738 RepID=A0A0G1L1C7_9BACT|nr:MAG: hypothetical protein UW49_C0014G0032 [Candidatus Giovannonibacteria bacterium GW2011_GWB1_44_23]KKT62387.1 MAG: hypothetical protein UW57_C0017G0010 [Candidatus Giovannonibacteria bacterium GW2011_GWA1_44_29]KKT83485.1 MAG: hypothetical protein UW81_C0017G0009 [Candidatus Giovannonibacteria bacterium GW2011_GWC2_44_9]